ncbi:hypothetical protein PF008_g1562 [Phytophthora fragariae]|uniref:Intradiol ring-cleavage dioxygenases domain-containing protein n=1 Tax=Phytophthora fragariae TaxID=53985 RepID=A0A6G0SKS0_9STRA|nr:hypothetical protein PF008_g1562 [Phytophthora fragariae]
MKAATFLQAAIFIACTASGDQELVQRTLDVCKESLATRKLEERTVARRSEAIETLHQERRQRRLGTSKHSSTTVTVNTTGADLFGSNTGGVVKPDTITGPYHIKGNLIRDDMREDQEGVVMYIDVQVIDVTSCDPVKGMYVEFMHANATGVNSGMVVSTNGDSVDMSNLNATFLRGATPTDEDGVAQMISIFPGHSVDRATHLFFIGNYGGTVLENRTYLGGSVSHVAQFYFDQELITSVEALPPYSTNNEPLTLNKDDGFLQQAIASGFDPIMTYALFGDTVDDGLFVWISVAVNMSAERDVAANSALSSKKSTLSMTSSDSSASGGATSITTTTANTASRTCKFGGFVALIVAFAPIFLELKYVNGPLL